MEENKIKPIGALIIAIVAFFFGFYFGKEGKPELESEVDTLKICIRDLKEQKSTAQDYLLHSIDSYEGFQDSMADASDALKDNPTDCPWP